MSEKVFFDRLRRSLFGGRLKQHHVDGINRILARAERENWPRSWVAYMLATVYHETGGWMQPIREGALRYGPRYSHASAVRAVNSIYAKGIIRRNYALPAGPYKQSYYGRGLVQITWYDNYKQFADLLGVPLDKNPDLALEWDTALDIAFIGMERGLFRGKRLADFNLPAQFVSARSIINGDVRKNGGMIAAHARTFDKALGGIIG